MTAYPNPYSPSRVLIVTYNLKAASTAYTKFYDTLKAQGQWWHYLPSTWLIYTNHTPEQVGDALRAHIFSGDHVFVGTLQNGYNGWLPKDAWQWLRDRGLSA